MTKIQRKEELDLIEAPGFRIIKGTRWPISGEEDLIFIQKTINNFLSCGN